MLLFWSVVAWENLQVTPCKVFVPESLFQNILSWGTTRIPVKFHVVWIIIHKHGQMKGHHKKKEEKNLPPPFSQPLCCTFILLITTMELHLLFLIMAADIKLHRRLRLVWHRDLRGICIFLFFQFKYLCLRRSNYHNHSRAQLFSENIVKIQGMGEQKCVEKNIDDLHFCYKYNIEVTFQKLAFYTIGLL